MVLRRLRQMARRAGKRRLDRAAFDHINSSHNDSHQNLQLETLETRVLLTTMPGTELTLFSEDPVLEPLQNITVDVGQDSTITVNDTLSLNATFSDADPDLSYTATVDWGDGSPVEPVTVQFDSAQQSSLTVTIDYSLDTNDFFDTQAKRDLIQSAADDIANRFSDTLDAIQPSGNNTWAATFTHPGTGQSHQVNNLSIAANEIIIYAGGRNLSSLGVGGPGGFSASGNQAWFDILIARGETGGLLPSPTDYGKWGGVVTFDSGSSDWFFGSDISGIGNNQDDFYSVALHEIAHVFGIGTSDSWDELIVGGEFVGENTVAEYDGIGNVPIDSGQGHFAEGVTEGGVEVAMDPTLLVGTRKELTALDIAAFDDIGWDILPLNNTGTITGSHTYTEVNTFNVTVTLEDENNESFNDSLNVTVDPVVLPEVNVVAGISAEETDQVPGEFTFTRSGSTDDPVTIFYTISGSAENDTDYTQINNSIIIPTGLSSTKLFITPVDDEIVEGNETVQITILANANYEIGDGDDDLITIIDNDTPPVPLGFIGGFVFSDGNGDSIFGKKELGLENVTLELFLDVNGDGLLDGGDTSLAVNTSDSIGFYSFQGLEANNYIVDVTDLNNVLTDLTNSSGNDPLAIVLGDDEVKDEIDFGYFDEDELVFGIVNPGDKPVKKEFRGVTYSLKGPGSGQIILDGTDTDIQITGSSEKSKAKFQVGKGQQAEIRNISILNGAIGSVDMKGADLTGDYFSQGSTGKFVAKDIDANHIFNIGLGTSAKASFSLQAQSVFDTEINSLIPIKSIKVATWEDNDTDQDSITAPWIGSISSANHFQADVTVTDNAVKSALKKLSVAKIMANLTIRSAGNVGSVTAGAMDNVSLFVGVDNSLDTLPTQLADFIDQEVTLGKVQLKGVSGVDDNFKNSRVAGFAIKSVKLGSVASENSGDVFGFAANTIGSIGYQVGETTFNVKKLSGPSNPIISDDFNILAL